MLPDGSLAGRVALVTGGGSGLGRAMALELGRRRHVLEQTVAQLDEGVAVPADVREPNLVEEAFDIAEAELGPITTLVTTRPATSTSRPRNSRRTAGAPPSASSSTARTTARASWRVA